MFRKVIIALVLILLALPVSSSAMGSFTAQKEDNSKKCKTIYPVVFAHGFGFKEGMLGFLDYFYKVEEAIVAEGGVTFTPTINAMDNVENKAKSFKEQVEKFMLLTGAEKVNIIGHSHGGIYTRYAITMLGMEDVVASHTSIDAPQRGSSGPDMVLEMCQAVNNITGSANGTTENIVGDIVDAIYGNILGDNNPNSEQNCVELSTDYMQNEFNPVVTDSPKVYYQSYAGVIKYISPSNSWAMLLWPAIGLREGANDGAVSEFSAKWGNYRGKLKGAWWSNGVDHIKVVGQPFGITPGFDAPEFYTDVVRELVTTGY
ncbi:MAG: alpha/beta hydrolase [Desulfobacterales bacterium]|nr:alpha/beta hydrolase [Desulfobacterales bacterium]MCP4159739.1 alpha/beta hydrolase [Deltaproteobacteria bacterium]